MVMGDVLCIQPDPTSRWRGKALFLLAASLKVIRDSVASM